MNHKIIVERAGKPYFTVTPDQVKSKSAGIEIAELLKALLPLDAGYKVRLLESNEFSKEIRLPSADGTTIAVPATVAPSGEDAT